MGHTNVNGVKLTPITNLVGIYVLIGEISSICNPSSVPKDSGPLSMFNVGLSILELTLHLVHVLLSGVMLVKVFSQRILLFFPEPGVDRAEMSLQFTGSIKAIILSLQVEAYTDALWSHRKAPMLMRQRKL